MRHKIAARLDMAAKALGDVPKTGDTRMLRAAPSAIVRMGVDLTGSLSDLALRQAANSKTA
jgi:hypothetical protein